MDLITRRDIAYLIEEKEKELNKRDLLVYLRLRHAKLQFYLESCYKPDYDSPGGAKNDITKLKGRLNELH